MKLNDFERKILTGVAADLERLKAADRTEANDLARAERGRFHLDWLAAQEDMVRPNLASWLHRAPTPSDFVKASRSYARLESAELLERVAMSGNRTTHLRLTAAGRAEAKRLVKAMEGAAGD